MEAKAGPSDRMTTLLLVVIIVAGVLLRTLQIGREALWGDEALTLIIARHPIFDLMFRPVDPTPGLYYVLQKLFVSTSAGAIEARSVALAAGILTIPAGYWLGSAAIGRTTGIWVAGLVAVSAWLVDYSQEARAYSLLVLLITCSAAALIDGFRDHTEVRGRMLALSFAFAISSIYTHLAGWFWACPGLVLAGLEANRRGQLRRRTAFWTAGIFVLLVTPEFFRLAAYAFSPINAFNWLTQPDFSGAVRIVANVLLPHSSVGWSSYPASSPWGAILLRGVFLAALAWLAFKAVGNRAGLSRGIERRQLAALVIAILLSMPLQAWFVGALISPVLMERVILPILPAFFVVIAGLARLNSGRIALSIIMLAYLIDSVALGLTRQKEPWRETVELIASLEPSAKRVVICPEWRAPALIHAMQEARLNTPVAIVRVKGPGFLWTGTEGQSAWQNRYLGRVGADGYQANLVAARRLTEEHRQKPGPWVLVRGDCYPRETAALRRWLGDGSARMLARLKRGGVYPPIEVWLIASEHRPSR